MKIYINSGNKLIPLEVEAYTPQQQAALNGDFNQIESGSEDVHFDENDCICMEDSMDVNIEKLKRIFPNKLDKNDSATN